MAFNGMISNPKKTSEWVRPHATPIAPALNNNPTGSRRWAFVNGNFAFFLGFLRQPALIGSIIPSSRFLERRVVEAAGITRSRMVVELGPGTGGTTRAILAAMPPEAQLLAIEINPDFAAYLKAVPDPRLNVYLGSAEHMRSALATVDHARPDAVVSGIPFSTMPESVGREILRQVWDCLASRRAVCHLPAHESRGPAGARPAGRPACPAGVSERAPPAGLLVAQTGVKVAPAKGSCLNLCFLNRGHDRVADLDCPVGAAPGGGDIRRAHPLIEHPLDGRFKPTGGIRQIQAVAQHHGSG